MIDCLIGYFDLPCYAFSDEDASDCKTFFRWMTQLSIIVTISSVVLVRFVEIYQCWWYSISLFSIHCSRNPPTYSRLNGISGSLLLSNVAQFPPSLPSLYCWGGGALQFAWMLFSRVLRGCADAVLTVQCQAWFILESSIQSAVLS